MYLVIFLLNSTKKGRLNIYPLKFFNYLFNSIIKSQILFEKSTGLSIENPSINKADHIRYLHNHLLYQDYFHKPFS